MCADDPAAIVPLPPLIVIIVKNDVVVGHRLLEGHAVVEAGDEDVMALDVAGRRLEGDVDQTARRPRPVHRSTCRRPLKTTDGRGGRRSARRCRRPAAWHRHGADPGRPRPVHVRLRRPRARPRAGDHHRVAAGPPDGGVLRGADRQPLRRPAVRRDDLRLPRRRGDGARQPRHRPTRPGGRRSARSTPMRSPARSARRRGGSTKARWPRWCSTSIVKRSITWPRSPCCATSSPTADRAVDDVDLVTHVLDIENAL